MKALLKWMDRFLPEDKLQHYFYAANPSFLIIPIAWSFSPIYGLISYITILIFLALKEKVWDGFLGHGTPSWLDFLIGALGPTQIIVTLYILK